MGTNIEKGKYATPEGSKMWEYLTALNCKNDFCSIIIFPRNSRYCVSLRR